MTAGITESVCVIVEKYCSKHISANAHTHSDEAEVVSNVETTTTTHLETTNHGIDNWPEVE